MRRFALILLWCATACAQTIPSARVFFGISDALKRYLELTDNQTAQISLINGELSEWQISRTIRQTQIRAEIAVEERKSPLDPMALGLRYAELESIRREVEDESVRVRRRILALLTDGQRQKVSELERVRTLAPVIANAECNHLLAPAEPDPIARIAGLPTSLTPAATPGAVCLFAVTP